MKNSLRHAIALAIIVLLTGSTVVHANVTTPMTVYFTFSGPQSLHLMPVAVAYVGEATPQKALELLITGPPQGGGLERNLPPDTEVLEFWIEEGVAYVSFSQDVLAGAAGSAGEALLIAAVTNTLCRFTDIDKVQFLIEGMEVDSLGGHFDAREPFEPQWDMVLSAPFTDVKGHWAEGNVHAFFLTGLIEGYGDGTFRPEREITRAEFVKLLVLATNPELVTPSEPTFSDVGPEHWAYRFIEAAVKHGIVEVSDYGERFGPDARLSRREMAVLLTRSQDLESRAYELRDAHLLYSDTELLPAWARGYVAVVTELGLMHGDDVGTFRPDSTATRAEAATVLTRLLDSGQENVRLAWPSDSMAVEGWVLLGGVARAFEGTVNARIMDEAGQEYIQTFTTATQGGPGWGFWAILLPVPPCAVQTTYGVEAFTISAKDGQEQDVVSRTITCVAP